jgi:GNAT superfamily N-acetyltransferase
MKDKDLGVKLAVEDEKVLGMIQYLPAEYSMIEGNNIYFIACIWVHGYKQGVGKHQKKGIGKTLLQAAEDDVLSKQADGLAAWGISMPFWMKASWFKKQGYKKVDKNGMAVLLFKPFKENVLPPKWIKEKKKPEKIAGKVTVTAFINGWCPAQNLVYERTRRAVKEFGDQVVLNEFNTFEKEAFEEWGISDGLFIDGKQIRTGPPPSYEKIKKKIEKRIKRLK